MALSDSGIAAARSKMSEFKITVNALNEELTNLKSFINADSNFQKFSAGTDRGQRSKDNVMSLVDIGYKTSDATDSLIAKTNSFLDSEHQKNLQKAKLNEENSTGTGGNY